MPETARPGLRQSLLAAAGIARSLRIYYGDRTRLARMKDLYARFIRPGDLVFDIGAHVGDRTGVFHRLGARVVAVEPQPIAFRCLQWMHGSKRGVTLLRKAVAAAEGELQFRINTRNPTVSTASEDFMAAAAEAPGWHGQRWDRAVRVEAVTLDRLIETYGMPGFIKIDIEGFEDQALLGLGLPVPALSFEFTTIQRGVAHRCLKRLSTLGAYRFNAALGESQSLAFEDFCTSETIGAWLDALPAAANSGDIYAVAGNIPHQGR